MDQDTDSTVNVTHKMNGKKAFLLIMPSLPSPIGPVKGQVEFVQSLCISPPVTPGLILMLNYFSFANDVARLQSNHPEYV